ncbi:MAG: HAD-IIB family hydrolase [Lachnospiraceae bacterium]|nr:HAD-IIB family hydrolase [Lachnospiraceae bacterium]
MNKKYFFFDIDGTLTDDLTKQMIPSAAKAIKKLQEAGHFVSIATGRAFYKAEPFRKEQGIHHMVCNGGHGIVLSDELKENRPIDYEKSLAIYRQAIELGYGVMVALDDSKKIYGRDFRFYEQAGIRKEPTTYIIDDTFDPSNQDTIYKMYISIPKEEEEKLTLKDTVGHLRFETEYLMFQPDAKREGIFRMLNYVGGKTEDVVVFGDDYNDLCMFDEQFYCVAMGNGCDELKQRADYITAKNTEDGIYLACKKHAWF